MGHRLAQFQYVQVGRIAAMAEVMKAPKFRYVFCGALSAALTNGAN